MAKTFQLAVVAPDRSVMDEPVQSVMAPGAAGYFGVLGGHEPTIFALRAGLVEFMDTNNQRHFIAVSGGFAEVTPERVTILADAAERASDIDIARAERALEEARKSLRGEGTVSREEATQEMERAMARIKAARH
ncbi:MAG TPA: ATP synthase F1 subunit epsilon [Fimbriimonadaceae bacterium]|nr:ATP synthase F1 subunit epsilon [Fimbriimonadaceae bacterium]